MPKLSIIVPVYNVKQYLDKCVQSILNQSYKDFELILVDDGSTDGSGEMCDKYKELDSRILVYHQKNQGQSVARNYALKLAKGDYIGFVDSDDWIEKNMFAEMMTSAIEQNADVVICRLQRVDDDGNLLELTGYDKSLAFNKIQATSEILKDDLLRSYPVNKLYKHQLFDGVEFPANRYFEDTATIYKLIYNADKIVTVTYIGYNYRFNINSTINNFGINYQKQVKREYDNALAFGERYMFCLQNKRLKKVRVTCADKAYMRMRSFIHLQAHKSLELNKEQKTQIDTIMNSFMLCDLKNFPWSQKMDAIAYWYCKPLLKLYLKLLAKAHPMNRDL